MKLGFIIPNYPGEKRVALLPKDLLNQNIENELIVEKGFGHNLDISDDEYKAAGCRVLERNEVFLESDAIFSLKLIQPSDYHMLREKQMVIGWTHPTGSGKHFMNEVAQKKDLVIVDLDNIYPKLYYKDQSISIDWLNSNFIYQNSINAGYSATLHAILSYGILPNSNTSVAVLSSGNVAQGAFEIMSKFGANVRMFYRKTMNEFYANISQFDIIINGIEVDDSSKHIISSNQLELCKKGCLLIDAAADAGNAIETTHYTSIDAPVYERNGLYFYEVNNAPSLLYRSTSVDISKSFVKNIYGPSIEKYYDLAGKLGY